MIPNLLTDLQALLRRLEDDLREQARGTALHAGLEAEYEQARGARRTGEAFEIWREQEITQAAVAWVLAAVFVRYVEDNDLVPAPYLAGPGERLQRARERQQAHYARCPTDADTEYLLAVFEELAALPGLGPLFDRAHNPLWELPLSPEGGRALLEFFRAVDPDANRLKRDFTDSHGDTRFLGDLYQDLSEAARKRYALLQTPEFVEEFILDRTLEPAIAEFGLDGIRLIDPTCGSGHFLLGAFERLLTHWQRTAPGINERELVQRSLNGVYGVDINPFAVAIARFRLLLAALRASQVARLSDAPNFKMHLVTGDSLLHGPRMGIGELALDGEAEQNGLQHAARAEDLPELNRILGQRYHAVVGNPPYPPVKDGALNKAYRDRYASCYMKFSLGVPFTERFFQLAVSGDERSQTGFVGMITANSFMKREFGKKLIEEILPSVDLTHVIDTAGAYLPGHGTSTVILLGRERAPRTRTVRAVMGIKGEPGTPADPAQGLVWRAIVEQVDIAGSESAFVSVADLPRETLAKHPWSIGGGGAADLKETIEDISTAILEEISVEVGIGAVSGEDDLYIFPDSVTAKRLNVEYMQDLVVGDLVRDWFVSVFPTIWVYSKKFFVLDLQSMPIAARLLWLGRSRLNKRKRFGTPMVVRGLTWYEWQELYINKLQTPLTITFAEVATHNHFVLDRGGKVFKQTAPVIKLPAGASEAEHVGLIGLLNSSTACFWLKQVCHNKGSTVDQKGARQTTDPFENFYQFNGTKVAQFPLAKSRPLDLAEGLDSLATALNAVLPAAVVARGTPTAAVLEAARVEVERLAAEMIAWQEELDWRCYGLYHITAGDLCHRAADGSQLAPPPLALGERAFEIVLARRMAAGELETTWFARHGSTPITALPAHWPADYRARVERRIAAIESERNLGLLERPEYKRRWNREPWAEQLARALRGWLLDRLETPAYWPELQLRSVRELAAQAQADAEFMQVAELYRGEAGFSVTALVEALVTDEAVPALPVLRYKDSGLLKRQVWERIWTLQRREDAIDAEVAAAFPARLPAIEAEYRANLARTHARERNESEADWQTRLDALFASHATHYAEGLRQHLAREQRERRRAELGDIPAPPKYASADFRSSVFWRLRGALDVPKERFISHPHAARPDDPSLLLGWAGWNDLQQAQAIAATWTALEAAGGAIANGLPLLAAIAERLPWLRQWHNAPDPDYGGAPLGDFFTEYLHGQLQTHGLSQADLDGWTPPAARRGRRRGGN